MLVVSELYAREERGSGRDSGLGFRELLSLPMNVHDHGMAAQPLGRLVVVPIRAVRRTELQIATGAVVLVQPLQYLLGSRSLRGSQEMAQKVAQWNRNDRRQVKKYRI